MMIEIAISTLNDGIKNIKINPKFNYLIIHQINNGKDYSIYSNLLKSKNARYIASYTTGLSKSRNIAISNADADYIWFMDDDVIIDEKAFENLKNMMSNDFDMLILSHSSDKKIISPKHTLSKVNKFSAASVSSIDMFVKRTSILKNSLQFNENFGLGTSRPSGEEFLFTIDMISANLKILKTNQIFSYHPQIASGVDFYSTPNRLNTKLEIFSLAYGTYLGRLVFLIFIIKKSKTLIKNRKLIMAIRIFFGLKLK